MSNGPEEHAEKTDVGVKGRTKDRSPNYPVMDLGKALEKVEVIHREFRTHEIPIGMAHERCNYKALSGAGNQCIAALRAYGLVKVTGQSDQRKVSVSVEGDRIVRDAPDRAELLKTAALKPTLHRELWDHYHAEGGIPPDDLLRHYLVWDRPEPRFNEKSVDGFIANFRATLKLAKLDCGDIIDSDADDDSLVDESPEFEGDDEMNAGTIEKPPVERKRPPEPSPTQRSAMLGDVGPYISFPLPGGNVIEIRLRSKVTPAGFEQIKKLVDLSESSLVEEIAPKASPPLD
jgi:hypothetical protein